MASTFPPRTPPLRVLLMADSHLGFDLPTRPRVHRRRRGHDFLSNHRRALEPAREGRVDLVVHGGDVFHRPRVPPSLVYQAFGPLLEVADAGVPVFVVPGNHERSRIPHRRFAVHPRVHVFHEPRTVTVEVRGRTVAVSGFPYVRRDVRGRFREVLAETGGAGTPADVRLLCMHHCVEGATVGPADFTFRNAPDVVRCRDLPREFAAVLSGHIHRRQVLERDLWNRRLWTPVLYPGSVERTAFAEVGEEKGYMLLELEGGPEGGRLVSHELVGLPARPMRVRDLHPRAAPGRCWLRRDLEAQVAEAVARAPAAAVLRLRVHGRVPPGVRGAVAAARLRRVAPEEMNLEVVLSEDGGSGRSPTPLRRRRQRPRTGQAQALPHASIQTGLWMPRTDTSTTTSAASARTSST